MEGLDWWLGFGFEHLALVGGKKGSRPLTSKPPIQTTNKSEAEAGGGKGPMYGPTPKPNSLKNK